MARGATTAVRPSVMSKIRAPGKKILVATIDKWTGVSCVMRMSDSSSFDSCISTRRSLNSRENSSFKTGNGTKWIRCRQDQRTAQGGRPFLQITVEIAYITKQRWQWQDVRRVDWKDPPCPSAQFGGDLLLYIHHVDDRTSRVRWWSAWLHMEAVTWRQCQKKPLVETRGKEGVGMIVSHGARERRVRGGYSDESMPAALRRRGVSKVFVIIDEMCTNKWKTKNTTLSQFVV